jgi:hypothetical protein
MHTVLRFGNNQQVTRFDRFRSPSDFFYNILLKTHSLLQLSTVYFMITLLYVKNIQQHATLVPCSYCVRFVSYRHQTESIFGVLQDVATAFLGWFNDAVSALELVQCWMPWKYESWVQKYMEGGRGLFEEIIPMFLWTDWWKSEKFIAGSPADIWKS